VEAESTTRHDAPSYLLLRSALLAKYRLIHIVEKTVIRSTAVALRMTTAATNKLFPPPNSASLTATIRKSDSKSSGGISIME
jgi:hypothetical protein